MRIVCPNCDAAYEVRQTLLRPGRPARCARCANRWVPVAEPTPDAVPGAAVAPPDDMTVSAGVAAQAPIVSPDDRFTPAPPPLGSTGLRLAWAGSITVLIVAITVAFVWHGKVIEHWPPSLRLFAAFGIDEPANMPRR